VFFVRLCFYEFYFLFAKFLGEILVHAFVRNQNVDVVPIAGAGEGDFAALLLSASTITCRACDMTNSFV